jgi:diguanylate cyclase (GGDEF)-like protein
MQFRRMQAQVPLLYIALILLVLTATTAARDTLHPVFRFGLPVAVSLLCAVRMIVWLGRRSHDVTPEMASNRIRSLVIISAVIGAQCSVWCAYSWMTADITHRAYFPLFMAMGTLSTAYCISIVRSGALINLAIGIPPTTLLLLTSGQRMDVAAACSLIIASAFLIRMIQQQHEQLVSLLLLQKQMQDLAETDSLTGLVNRRALYARLESEIAKASGNTGPALVMIDLDGFKPVNDMHGHIIGDEVLRQVAGRFRRACDNDVMVARLGGDEFAILLPARSNIDPHQAAERALTALVPPFAVAGHPLRIGASAGIACWPEDGTTPEGLIVAADHELYAAKARLRDSATGWTDTLVEAATRAA